MADINAIAHGVDTETGEYLSPEERKALFKGKGKMGSKINPQSFRSGIVSATRGEGGGGGGLVKFSGRKQTDAGDIVKLEEQEQEQEFETNEVQNLFQEIRSTFYEVHKVKNEKKNLQSKFLDLLGKSKQTEIPQQEEETPKKKSGMGLGRKVSGAATGLFAGIFGILGDLLQFAVLDWISKPENKKTVETFVKIFQGVFKFLDWWITTAVDNLLSGFAELVGGDSILERIGGFFKLVGGFFMFRWLLNPFKMVKDLGRVNKVLGKFVKIFKSIFKLGDGALKKGLGAALKLAGKAFRVALGRTLKRFLIKLFGKAFTKGALALGKMLLKRAVGLVRRFPLIGPVIAFGLELAMGEPPGRAAFKAIGATLLGGLGGVIGSIVPGAGTLIGAVIGGLAGEWAGGAMYDLFFKGKEGDKKKEETPGMSTGGIASGPRDGYLVMLHGTEVVIPIARIGEILAAPFKQLGAGIIGGMMAVINSIGPAANFVKPIMVSLLGSTITDFGIIKFTKTDTVGKTEGSSETLSRHIESERNKQDLDKLFGKDLLKDLGSMLMITGGSIFNSILGGGAQAATSSGGGGGAGRAGGAGNTPSGTTSSVSGQAGNMNKGAEMLRNAGVPDRGAAYLAGNIQQESSWNGQRDWGQVLGDGTSRNGGLVSWASWSDDPARLGKIEKYLGKNIKEASDGEQINAMLWEMKNYYPGAYKVFMDPNSTDQQLEKASYQYWGYGEVGERYHYAQQALQHLQKSPKQTTPPATASPTPGVTPTPLTPEQKSKMFQKAGMPALSSRVSSSSSSSSSSEVTQTSGGFSVPSPPPASLTLPTPTSAAMVPMSNQFSIDRKLRSSSSRSDTTIISNFNNYNAHMNVQRMELNRTSIASSIINNRI